MVGRRVVLRGGLALAVLAGAAGTVDAQKKATQKMVQYQQKPKANQECDECLHFEPPSSCKMVEGTINPKGWCSLFAVKPKAK
jgi:hypothetical protein